jgi:hypothetical protein
MRPTSSSRELSIIAASLQSIHAALGRLAPALGSAGGDIPEQPPSSKRKLKLSPARRAALKLQGQYMGYMRGLKPAQKKTVKALAASKGVSAAVNLARRLARG